MDEFLQLFHDKDHRFPELAAKQGISNKVRVFIAVADDEAFRVCVHGQRGKQLGLAAGFDAKMPWRPGIKNLLYNFAQLVDFDGKNPAVHATVPHLGNRLSKRKVNRLHTIAEQIVEPHDERKGQMPRSGLLHNLHQIDLVAVALRAHNNMSFLVDSEVSTAPAVNIVKRDSIPAVEVGRWHDLIGNKHEMTLGDRSRLFFGHPALGI